MPKIVILPDIVRVLRIHKSRWLGHKYIFHHCAIEKSIVDFLLLNELMYNQYLETDEILWQQDELEVINFPLEQHIKECLSTWEGFGLFFLAAASKHEFDKMKELRTQMEVILQDVKEELQRKHTISGSSDSNKTPAYSTTRAQEAPNF
ncbi:hypothetical protein CK203_005035 [Vitis vinifera]|uniref:Uncharacterized protein n=1 Tax=Vitis vinifera TaxID=29760 RepID=A0A438KEU1_VITVI|nr:hypothetical protein CK203_005035 [Vitis vinifera]